MTQGTISKPNFRNRAEVSFDDELLILVDGNDEVTGYGEKLSVHEGSGKLHRAFSIFLFSPCGQVLMQQRSAEKLLWPLYWSNSVCSHPRKGESNEVAARRRLREELGVSTELDLLFRFEYSAEYGSVGTEHELCNVYAGCIDLDYPVVANENEVADWNWFEIADLDRRLDENPQRFTPWLRMEWAQMRARGYLETRLDKAVGSR